MYSLCNVDDRSLYFFTVAGPAASCRRRLSVSRMELVIVRIFMATHQATEPWRLLCIYYYNWLHYVGVSLLRICGYSTTGNRCVRCLVFGGCGSWARKHMRLIQDEMSAGRRPTPGPFAGRVQQSTLARNAECRSGIHSLRSSCMHRARLDP